DVDVVVRRVALVRRRTHLRAPAHERVAGDAGRVEVAAVTVDPAEDADVRRVIRLERLHQSRRGEARAAVGRGVVRDRIDARVAADVRELAVRDIDVSVAGDGDVRELDV